MKTNHKITAALAGAILLIALAVAASFWAFGQIGQTAEARMRAFVLLNRADDLLAALKDAETGEHGFALTGDETFLEPYLAVRGGISGQLQALRQLTLTSAALQHLDALAPLAEAMMVELARVIELRRKENMPGVIATIGGGEGKRLMDSIRAEMKGFIQLQEIALVQREAQFQATLRRLFAVIVTVSVLALLSAGAFAYLVYRDTQHQLKDLVHRETRHLLGLQTGLSQKLQQANATLQISEEQIRQLNAELGQRVINRTGQLEAANKELEAFTYTVSHDLRTPVRAIDGFSQAVLEDFGPQLPDEGRRYLTTIRQSARQMGALIDDLLAFSRLNQQDVNKRAINTGQLVRGTLDELGCPWPARQVALRLGDLPPSSGDPALLKQVWQNLLSNALKYTRQRKTSEIEIGCMTVNGADAFFVRDNGTGFDLRHAGKLFGVFQRLHRAEDYEGTGVGLAIVQRIVQRHGGRVWADAAVDRGATFYFTLEKETKP